MAVLKLLESQVKILLDTGRTDHTKFRDELGSKALAVLDPGVPTGDKELDSFYDKVKESGTNNKLLIKGTNFQFPIDSLKRLGKTGRLNDDIILACLHLADKLPFVRVGFSIPIHQSKRKALPRPFQMAEKKMAEWHRQVEVRCDLVCFFPLLHHESHFSLLEFNERDGSIYHYDSMSEGENADVKVR